MGKEHLHLKDCTSLQMSCEIRWPFLGCNMSNIIMNNNWDFRVSRFSSKIINNSPPLLAAEIDVHKVLFELGVLYVCLAFLTFSLYAMLLFFFSWRKILRFFLGALRHLSLNQTLSPVFLMMILLGMCRSMASLMISVILHTFSESFSRNTWDQSVEEICLLIS